MAAGRYGGDGGVVRVVLKIESARVSAAGGKVSETGGLLNGEINRMNEMMADLRSGWRSDTAAPSFYGAMSRHLESVTQLKDALLTHGASLANDAAQINQTEAANAIGGAS